VTALCLILASSFILVNVDLKPSANALDLIEVQKVRAISRWEEAFAKKYVVSEKIYNDVLKQLRVGRVPPIYHTFCRDPLKRLFLPNVFVSKGDEHSGSITISAKKATAGSSEIPLTSPRNLWYATHRSVQATGQKLLYLLDYQNTTWLPDNFSYLDAFFTKDGHVFTSVRDDLLKENWQFDKETTNVVTDLVNSSAKMLGHDLELTELSSAFPVDRKNGRNLITRSLSRGVVADCFEHSEAESPTSKTFRHVLDLHSKGASDLCLENEVRKVSKYLL
jgi:hypothetical protein